MAAGIPALFRSSLRTVLSVCVSGSEDDAGGNGRGMDRNIQFFLRFIPGYGLFDPVRQLPEGSGDGSPDSGIQHLLCAAAEKRICGKNHHEGNRVPAGDHRIRRFDGHYEDRRIFERREGCGDGISVFGRRTDGTVYFHGVAAGYNRVHQ